MDGGRQSGMVSMIVAAHADWEEYPMYGKRHSPSLVMQVVMNSGVSADMVHVKCHWCYWQ